MVLSSSAPSAAPTTVPLPPKIATPPTTTAATTSQLVAESRRVTSTCGVQGEEQRAGEAGERAADDEGGEHPPGRWGSPASAAASGLEPIAYRSRPDRKDRIA